MRIISFSAISILALAACAEPVSNTTDAGEDSSQTAAESEMVRINYPETATVDQVDTYNSQANGSVDVADPYRWLED